MSDLYPWGYARALVSMSRLKALARVELMEDEAAQRFFAYIGSKNGRMGIGGAVRFEQPDLPGFAPNGKSFHQLQTFDDGDQKFMALDLVMRNGSNIHRSPTWSEVPAQGTKHIDSWNYGVHANVTGEPWHLQVIEVDGYDTWVYNGRNHPNSNFRIRGTVVPISSPSLGNVIVLGSRVLRLKSPTMYGTDVQQVQRICRRQGLEISIDSYYGRQTRNRVKIVQGWNDLEQDGVVGPKTVAALLAY